MRLGFSGLALLALGACSYVPVATMMKMARFDPLSADPLGMVVTIEVPPGVGIEPGSERLHLTAMRSDTGEVSDEVYVLDRRGTGGGDIAYRIADGDIARMRDQQALVSGWESMVPDLSNGSISLSLMPCSVGDGPGPRARVSASLEVAATPDRTVSAMPLFRNAPLAKLLPEGPESLHECDVMPSVPR